MINVQEKYTEKLKIYHICVEVLNAILSNFDELVKFCDDPSFSDEKYDKLNEIVHKFKEFRCS